MLEQERRILTRVARGGPLADVLRDIALLVEQPTGGQLLASILIVSDDGRHLVEGAAPSLPPAYNAAIDGVAIGPSVGSCGTAAHTGEPVCVADIANDPLWSDFRDLAAEHGLAACWSVPIKGSDGTVLGTFANYYRQPGAPTAEDMDVIAVVAQTAAIAIERHRNEAARARAEEQRMLLLHELNHRVKNVFALAQSLITLSAAATKDAAELANLARGRLAALGRAHSLVIPDAGAPGVPPPEPLVRDLLASILSPYAMPERTDRIGADGPELRVASHALTDIALVLHELASNAAKHGALSVAEGRIDVTWRIEGDRLKIEWREHGGPAVAEPARSGFGSMLARRIVEQKAGALDYDWASTGVGIVIDLPLSGVSSAG